MRPQLMSVMWSSPSKPLLDQLAPRKDDVLTLLIDFDHLELVGVAHESGEILGRDDVDLRGRQKRFDTDVDQQPPLDHGLDFAGDRAALVANGEDAIPVLLEFGFFLGEDNHAVLVLQFFDQDIDLVADLDGFDVLKFIGRDHSLALVTDIDQDLFGAHFNDGSFDDFAGCEAHCALLQGFFHR